MFEVEQVNINFLFSIVSFPSLHDGDVEEMAQRGVYAIFRRRSIATARSILNCMERRERSILLLLDGQRTLQDIARLTQRSEVEIAHMLIHLLRRGYIEFLEQPGETSGRIAWGTQKENRYASESEHRARISSATNFALKKDNNSLTYTL